MHVHDGSLTSGSGPPVRYVFPITPIMSDGILEAPNVPVWGFAVEYPFAD